MMMCTSCKLSRLWGLDVGIAEADGLLMPVSPNAGFIYEMRTIK